MIQEISELPPIPEKRYFTIGEVSKLCLVKPHVLRYWEQEFSHISPSKRMGRRYYQVDDVLIIRTVRQLLYIEGFTISGAKQRLEKEKKEIFMNDNTVLSDKALNNSGDCNRVISETITALENLLKEIS